MSVAAVGSYAIHLIFAGLWSGSVLFVSYTVVPMAMHGDLRPGPLAAIAGKLTTISRVSAVLLLLTGGHLAGARYTTESLTGSTAGRLVVAMVVLWLALGGLVEVGTSKLRDGTERNKVREPAAAARPFLLAASLVAVLLLANAGAIIAVNLGLL